MKSLLHNNVYFIGIGGIGMSALAKLLFFNGCKICGSNLEVNEQVQNLVNKGITIHIGHDVNNLDLSAEVVVHSSAVNESNVEMKKAKELGLPTYDYHEYLGLISKQYKTIAVAGTHGKSTTTALVAKILIEANFDPTVIVGSKVPGIDDNFRAGESEYLVVEADEFNFGMLHICPNIILLNNIEADHLDCFGNLDNIIKTFSLFIDKLPENGCLIYNADDKNVQTLLVNNKVVNSVSVGKSSATNIYSCSDENNIMTVNGEVFKHQLWGEYNDANLAIAISLALYLQVPIERIQKAISEFTGIWRRFEVLTDKALNKNITIVSDYAHHPTALAGIIKAAQKRYANKKVWTIFQPHHYDRVSNFFNDFVEAMKLADNPVIVRTYDVPGRETNGVRLKTSQDIANEVKNCKYLDNVSMVTDFIKENDQDNSVFIVIGAGTIDEVVRKNLC